MSIEKEKTVWTQLSIVGFLELAAFAAIAVWITLDQSNGADMSGQLITMYLFGGVTLVPSAISFIRGPKKQNRKAIRSALTMQRVLFIFVCLAALPAMIFASWHPQYFLACLIGFVFFLVASSMVNYLDPKAKGVPVSAVSDNVPVSEAPASSSNLAGQFCSKCGSLMDSTGKCSECA